MLRSNPYRLLDKVRVYCENLRNRGIKELAHVASPVTSMSEDVQIREVGGEKKIIAEAILKLIKEG